MRSASRTGVREMPRRAATTGSRNQLPAGSSPAAMPCCTDS